MRKKGKLLKKPSKRTVLFKKKVCRFCIDKADKVDYKDVSKLVKFITERGKIVPSRVSGTCAKHQRKLAQAIKRARFIAILPYAAE
ncbi:MAG: 30S ribosomal protein S18 [Candidatus Omnitrophica bacterium]|nr:30S ribosomal protein S18 [Candidatus Omnitrophota bacterium]